MDGQKKKFQKKTNTLDPLQCGGKRKGYREQPTRTVRLGAPRNRAGRLSGRTLPSPSFFCDKTKKKKRLTLWAHGRSASARARERELANLSTHTHASADHRARESTGVLSWQKDRPITGGGAKANIVLFPLSRRKGEKKAEMERAHDDIPDKDPVDCGFDTLGAQILVLHPLTPDFPKTPPIENKRESCRGNQRKKGEQRRSNPCVGKLVFSSNHFFVNVFI